MSKTKKEKLITAICISLIAVTLLAFIVFMLKDPIKDLVASNDGDDDIDSDNIVYRDDDWVMPEVNGEVVVQLYLGSDKKVVIPENKNGRDVVRLIDSSFFGNKSLEEVVIPNTVTAIDEDVFMECTELSRVTMHSSVKEIGANAFFGVSELTVDFYGTEAEFKAIAMGEGNEALKNATVNYIN